MRICLVSQEYPPETGHGGIASQTHRKAHGLAQRGHDVTVLAASSTGQRTVRFADGVRVVRIPTFDERMNLHSEAARWLTYSAEVAAALDRLQSGMSFDLVEFPEWAGEGYIYLLNQAEWNRTTTVVQLHGPIVMFAHALGWPAVDTEFYRVGTMMERGSLRMADAVYSSSQCSKQWCEEEYRLSLRSAPILHSGVDVEMFSPQPRRPGPPTVVFVGRIDRHKGADHLVEACCRIAAAVPGLRLKMYGRPNPDLARRLTERVRAAKFPDLLDMPGPVDRRDLPAKFAEADVFAAPSLYEGGPGFVYLEAMACGLPVVGCSGSGVSESVVHDHCGLLVPPGNVEELAQALLKLLTDAKQSREMGRRGRQRVLEIADSRSCIGRIEDFYREVINSVGREAQVREEVG
jgi:glycosyltransferase involved in cell wall biosynthesis